MLVFSVAVSSLTGVIFGVVPAIVSARVDVREALQSSGRGSTGGGRQVRGLLVGAEVALAVVLLIVMTMLAKSFANVQSVAPGFDATHVLSTRLSLPASRFNTRDSIVVFQRTLADRLVSVSGVTDASAISLLPLSGLLSRVPFTVEGKAIEREHVPLAQFRTVSAGYFEAARIPVRRGRTFSDRDTDRTRAVAVVSEELANAWLQDVDPVGARLLVDDNDGPPRPVEIVGVVGNVQQVALDGGPTWDLYLTYPQIHADNVGCRGREHVLDRPHERRPDGHRGHLAREVRRLDPEVAASQIRPMEQYLADAVAPRRFSLSLMVAFAGAAMTLAIIGIYAVVAYSISQRAREIGIRMALGASRASVVTFVMRQGVGFILGGLVAGVAMALGVTRFVSTMLYGLAATDAASFVEVAVVVLVASMVACAVPAARTGSLVLEALKSD